MQRYHTAGRNVEVPILVGKELAEYDSGEEQDLTDKAMVYLDDMTNPSVLSLHYELTPWETGYAESHNGIKSGPYITDHYSVVRSYFINCKVECLGVAA